MHFLMCYRAASILIYTKRYFLFFYLLRTPVYWPGREDLFEQKQKITLKIKLIFADSLNNIVIMNYGDFDFYLSLFFS